MRPKSVSGFIIPIIVGVFNLLIILFPTEMIAAAREGLDLWAGNVLPSLLPFIIFTNILSGLGVIELLGSMLEPIMRPLFGVSGAGGFALAAGMASGYPMGAKAVAQLRGDGVISRVEAQRLMAFCNNAGPLFMLGAVGVSMLNSSKAGYFIMAVHYISAIVTGILFKYYGGSEKHGRPSPGRRPPPGRQPSPAGFGAVLGGSVKNAMETIALVGGFIILFCVIVKILEVTRLLDLSEVMLSGALGYFGISSELYRGFTVGILEMTNGARILSAGELSAKQMAAVCGLISFGGFCVHAQAISFISGTDIKASVYIIAKAVQAFIAATTSTLLFPILVFTNESAVPVFLSQPRFWQKLVFSSASFAALIAAIAVLYISRSLLRRR